MLRMTPQASVYLACGVTDLRNNIDGLALIVQRKFNLDPFSNALFVFCNRKRNKLKILFWDKNGFWLYYRRLESGHFNWPQIKDNGHTLAVSEQQLSWLLDGLQLVEKDAHKEVLMRKLIPYEYLKYVMDRMSSEDVINEELIEDLLPWSENIPAYVKNPSET